MKRSIFAIGFIAMLIIFFITGCGGGGGGNNSTSGSNEIIINSTYTVNSSASDRATKYANAYKISGATLATATIPNSTTKLLAYDSGISVTTGTDGITLTNTTSTGNLCFTIGKFGTAGCFDFTALSSVTGSVKIDFAVDITGGGYIRAFNGSSTTESEMVTSQIYVTSYTPVSNSIESMDTNSSVDNVYFQVTLPKNATMKIYDIYLYMETVVTGFANMSGLITGGTGASDACTYTVTNAAEFKTALTNAANDSGASIIKVNGEITFADWCTANGWTSVPSTSTSSTYRYINIGSSLSNLTILGVGTAGIFSGVGFKVSGTNIIIKNVTVHEVLGQDGIQINNGTYIQVDHCNLYNYTTALESNPSEATKDTYDELISAKNNAHHIIISWNRLTGSYKTILVGSNDDADAKPDRKMIIHHNYFENCGSRLPLYRGGFAHIYNNYYYNCSTGSCINCRTGSKLKIEKNYFQNCKDTIGFWYDITYPTGYWDVNDNVFFGCSGAQPTTSTCTVKFESGYTYTLDDVASVPSLVANGAGVGKI